MGVNVSFITAALCVGYHFTRKYSPPTIPPPISKIPKPTINCVGVFFFIVAILTRVRGKAQCRFHRTQRFRKLRNRGGYLAEGWIISGLCPPVGGSGGGGPREEERVFCGRGIIGWNAPGGAHGFELARRLSWSRRVGARKDRPEVEPSH